jgi:hypothetical protein
MQAEKKPATEKMLAIPGMPATSESHAKDASINRSMIAKAKKSMYLMNPATP